MRTNIDAIVTTGIVFGFGQDCTVATRFGGAYSHAAQHLNSWQSGKRLRRVPRVLKRVGVAVAGVALLVEALCLAVAGPGRMPARLMSPALVKA